MIKIFLFFFFYNVNFVVNALFFNDSTMHKIFIDDGDYNFIYQLPNIIYTAIISGVINSIIKFLSLPEKNIIEFKQEKDITTLELKGSKLKGILLLKFTMFFILTFLFLLMFAYYIICFCGIYINTQIHLIKDTIISFITSFFTPFVVDLIPGIFRMIALNDKKKNKKYLYNLSKLIQNLLN